MKNPKYEHIKERNKEIYLSSAYYKYNWAYKHFLSFISMMRQGKNYFICCLPYQLSVMEGVKNIEELQEEYMEEGTDEALWQMEYECVFIGSEDSTSFFKYDRVDPCRRIQRAFYSKETMELADKTDKYFDFMKKTSDEVRILFIDVARKDSDGKQDNDATAIGLMIGRPTYDEKLKTTYFMREVPYLETVTGMNTTLQSLRIRKLFEWFECDYICIDAQNVGASIIDNLAVPMADPETGDDYEPLNCINHEELHLGDVLYPSYKKVIYGIMANAKLNSDIGYAMRDTINQRKLRLLVSENTAKQYVNQIKGYENLAPEQKGKFLQPYVQISALVNEMVGLQYTINPDTNTLKLSELSGARKDRYSAMSYSNYYMDMLERDLYKPKNLYEELEIEFFQF